MRAISVSRPSKDGTLDRGTGSRCFCCGDADIFSRFAILGLCARPETIPVLEHSLSRSNKEGMPRSVPLLRAKVGNPRVDGSLGCNACGANPLTPLALLKVRFDGLGWPEPSLLRPSISCHGREARR